MKKILILILSVTLLFSSCSFTTPDRQSKSEKTYIRGVWITYEEIKTVVDSAATQNEFQQLLYNKLYNLKQMGINTVFLHVRAFDDAFYNSEIFLPSEYASENGKLKFDVLATYISVCNILDIDIHAWINPYRIRNDGIIEKLSEKSYAYQLYADNPNDERLIICDKGIYYNPIYSETRSRIISGINEILENYEIDGIHFDDYFYPTTDESIDNEYYNDYITGGGWMDIEDLRRSAVDSLMAEVYRIANDNGLVFSVSPSANIEKNKKLYYADVEKWLTTSGYVDYIIPQIYFGFNHDTMPFEKCLEDWLELYNGSTKLLIGLASYKSGKDDFYAGSGRDEWINNSDVIERQILKIGENENICGYVLFSSTYLE